MIGLSFLIAIAISAAQSMALSERATVLQLSLDVPNTGAAAHQKAMEEEAAKITSCVDGLKLMDRLKARGLHGRFSFSVKTDVPLAALPPPLRDALMTRPIGRATPVFGAGEAFRVLVRCEATFIVPQPLKKRKARSI